MTGRRRRSATAVAAVFLVAALAACADAVTSGTARWYVAPGADLTGDVLPIVVEHGSACEEYAGVDVVESEDAVQITVRLFVHVPDDGSACPEAATVRPVDVPLDAPLGARTLRGPGHEETPALG